MKTKNPVLKMKFNKWFICGVAIVLILSGIIFVIGMKNSYDYAFVIGFDYFIIKYLYIKIYLNKE
jgi:hypothetical protein